MLCSGVVNWSFLRLVVPLYVEGSIFFASMLDMIHLFFSPSYLHASMHNSRFFRCHRDNLFP